MDELIYVVKEYPVVVIGIVLYILVQLFGGKKRQEANIEKQKAAEARKEEMRALAAERARATQQRIEATATSNNTDLMSVLRNAYNALETTPTPQTQQTTLTLASAPVLGDEERVAERPVQERDVYEVRTNVYDDETELERMDMAALPVPVHRGFGYHSASEEPDALEYHTKSFFGFQEVHGLHAAGPVGPEPAETETPPLFSEGMSRSDLVRAVVLTEVLSPPLSRRRR